LLNEEAEQRPGQRRQHYITNPPCRATPLSEFNNTQKILSLAFPTLYPYSQADFLNPRFRLIDFAAYCKHLLKYKDGRFAKHGPWRYVVFNTLMRRQETRQSSFLVKQHPEQNALTVDDLRAAFNDDTDESQALLNSIVRHSPSLRGTRAFWNGKRHNLEASVYQLGTPTAFLTFSCRFFA
jgi:ATP-dependent DNA helicase PIF1